MARRRRGNDEEAGHGKSERWLLTYSDMITLLLALFIIMYGMSTENQEKLQAMSQALSQAFNVSTSAGSNAASAEGKGGAAGIDAGGNVLDNPEDPLQDVYNKLNGYIKEEDLQDDIELQRTEHSISIRVRDSLLFLGDSTELTSDSVSALKKVSSIVQGVYDNVHHITITGNTADLGNHDPASESYHWQLSINRALKVLNALTDAGLSPEKMSIEGNSHYNPVADNSTKDGRAKNRRVEITITDSAN